MPDDRAPSRRDVEIGPVYEAARRRPDNGGTPVDHSREAPALAALQRRGFTHEFLVRHGRLLIAGSERSFRPAELRILDYYRFEGTSDPDDMSVIYAIEARDGTRGTLTDAFGAYADPAVGAIVDRIPVTPFATRRRWRRSLVVAALGALAGALVVTRLATVARGAAATRGAPRLRRGA
jgi:hypothetical protein